MTVGEAPGASGPVTVAALRAGALEPVAAVESCLERIGAVDGEVHAWQRVDAGGARADAASPALAAGPLRGVPVGVKDIFDTAGLVTGYGSPRYAEHVPARDAAAVARIRAAGGIVLGKTVTTEFALFHPGPTANPHALEHTPGGSSSGSAAAVAAGMVPLALGTQTAGSVIRPAAFCGVVGYKPTFGWVSRAGCLAVSETLDHVGLFARTIADAALLGGVLTGRDLTAGPGGRGEPPSLGLYRPPEWATADASVRDVLERVAGEAAGAGARVVELAPVDDYEAVREAQQVVMAFENARELAYEWTVAREELSVSLRERLEAGRRVAATDYDAAVAVAVAARAQASERLAGVDALLTLSAPGPAPHGLEATGDPICNRVWTLLGVPCVHLPVGFAAAPPGGAPPGLPVGVQLAGARATDARLLSTAAWVARCLGVETAPLASC